jgi:hypothetical protein
LRFAAAGWDAGWGWVIAAQMNGSGGVWQVGRLVKQAVAFLKKSSAKNF